MQITKDSVELPIHEIKLAQGYSVVLESAPNLLNERNVRIEKDGEMVSGTYLHAKVLKQLYDFLNLEVFPPNSPIAKENYKAEVEALEKELEADILGTPQ